MIKPDVYTNTGKIIDCIYKSGFIISNLKMGRMTPNIAGEFYQEHRGKGFYGDLVNFMTSDVVTGIEMVSDSAVDKWRKQIGPTDSQRAKVEDPNSIRALFGTDGRRNAVHGSDSGPSYKREMQLFFD